MKKIEEPFAGTLKNFSKSFDISNASRVTSNYAGFFHDASIDAVINNLVCQLSNSVLWRENMQVLARHASQIYEIGPGRPLRDFFRTIDVTCDSITGLTAAEKIFSRAS
jgi:[acyl-carrier-protein] S-malonyltransferase/trans-AT polyketide synthase/acyltransferase/oxidoreductase domain-containing protein